ncbi:MAG: Rieske 2Fe-2S domain-containing protein [Gammaproteobacteria bacterium]|nr:Rieske 2Fe-2S domain-containing protein [Gammaproteobacteria bacterium]
MQHATPPLDDFHWPAGDGSQVPYAVFTDPAIFEREQARIYRGPTWHFLALEDEIRAPFDFKSTYIGTTPVVVTRTRDGEVAAWVNRCAHRGALVCRQARGSNRVHRCVYHQWAYDERGKLRGVPFQKGLGDKAGMPADFSTAEHGLPPVRVACYRGLVFGTLGADAPELLDYIGPEMLPWVDRIFHSPVEYLGCTRQYARSNWKLYYENVKDPYHASLLHLFHTTFNIYRSNMAGRTIVDSRHGLHSIITTTPGDDTATAGDYAREGITTYREGLKLADPSLLETRVELAEQTSNNIHTLFPSTVIQQIHNTLAVRQVLPKRADEFELVFHFFGYADDDAELRRLRLRQANLVGPAGYISMEDTEATELVQRAVASCAPDDGSYIAMGDEARDGATSLVTEHMIRAFWRGYRELMGWGA